MSAATVPGGSDPGTRPTDRAPGSPPVVAHAVLEAMRQAMAVAPSSQAPGWAWEERAQTIATLDRVGELLGVYRAGLLSAHKEDGRWAQAGDRSFEGFRGRTAQTGFGAARKEMELADGLREMPQAAKAVEDGTVGLAHAGVLSRVHARGSQPVREALARGGADHLLAVAQGMDAAAFAKQAEAWAATQDAAAVEASHEEVRRRRYVRVMDRDGGTRKEAFVDSIAGAALRTALEALTPVPAADDSRTPEQRRADALTAMASRVLDRGADKIGAQIGPHVSLLVPAETWAAVQARRQASEGVAGDGHGAREGGAQVGPVPMPELDDGTIVPLSELERISCDCEVTRVVLGAEGVPLDVGRVERTYQKSLRRAALVRDGHCRWPGCTMRASWCEVHHVRWYSRGGRTSLDNGLTLCSFHHHEVHKRDVEIRSIADGHVFTRRDGTHIGISRRPVRGPARKAPPGRPRGGSGGRADGRADGGARGKPPAPPPSASCEPSAPEGTQGQPPHLW